MKINTLFYSIKQGFKNIFRNKTFSLASVATMAACIFMFGIFYIIVMNFNAMVKSAEESVAITVFFEEGVEEATVRKIGEDISKRGEVSSIHFVSAEEAWESFKSVYFKDREELAAGFANDNPLANSANYEVYVNDISMQDSLVKYIKGMEGVREVKQSQDVANMLADFNRLVSYISIGIILILLCVAIFLISNTVSVGISVRKEEISIMKLIGATDFLVRAPFLVEGVTIGFVGAALPLLLLLVLYERMVAYIANKFDLIGSMLQFIPASQIFQGLVPIAVLLGVGIGFIGSRFTIRKHLNV